MKNRIFAASYERGVELIAAGCPLDYPGSLPHSAARREPFRAQQLDGYAESRVYALGPLQTVYLIGLRLETDSPSGIVISEWSFVPPWQDLPICWDHEARDIIPKSDLGDYEAILDSPLTSVLNEGRLLRRGYPVKGLLGGSSPQSVPECGDDLVTGQLTLVDDQGNTVELRIALTVIRRRAAARSKTSLMRAGQLFDRMHKLAS